MNSAESQNATMIKQLTRRPPATPPATPKAATGPPKGAEISEQIGRELRAMFDGVVAEPVPEKFRQLLEELERKTGKG
jgi:hypothetical protein